MISGKYIIDRFEGEQAALLFCSDESVEIVRNRNELPQDAAEGDILQLDFESDKLISSVILNTETETARKKARDLINKLRNK